MPSRAKSSLSKGVDGTEAKSTGLGEKKPIYFALSTERRSRPGTIRVVPPNLQKQVIFSGNKAWIELSAGRAKAPLSFPGSGSGPGGPMVCMCNMRVQHV